MEATNKYKELAKYIDQFANLNVLIRNGVSAPHKPILLLTIISLIESGDIWENAIRPTDKVRAIFEALWMNHVHKESPFAIAPWTPFWHLKNEPFWHFKPKKLGFDIDNLVGPGQTASIGQIRDNIDYAYLDTELFEILQDKEFRVILQRQLIETYLSEKEYTMKTSWI